MSSGVAVDLTFGALVLIVPYWIHTIGGLPNQQPPSPMTSTDITPQ